MTLTAQEAEVLQKLAAKAGEEMLERGAHCVLVLWSREVGGRWLMEWARQGSPYEAVSLAGRYGVMDAQQAQAFAIGQELNKPEGGEEWKNA